MNLGQLFDSLAMNIISQSNLPPSIILRIGQMYADSKRYDMLATALEKYVSREPANPTAWVNLAAAQATLQRTNDAIKSLRRAVEIGGEPVRDLVRKDGRFNPIRSNHEFNALVPPIQAGMDLPLNLPLQGL